MVTAHKIPFYIISFVQNEPRCYKLGLQSTIACRITCWHFWQCNWGSRFTGVRWNINCGYNHGSYRMVYSTGGSSGYFTALLPEQEEKETFIVSYRMLFWCCNIDFCVTLTFMVKNMLQNRSLIFLPLWSVVYFSSLYMLKWSEIDVWFNSLEFWISMFLVLEVGVTAKYLYTEYLTWSMHACTAFL